MSEAIYHTVSPGNAVQTAKAKSILLAQLNDIDCPSYILMKNFFYLQYNEVEIQETLKKMTHENAYYMLVANANKSIDDLQVEKVYQTKFAVEKFTTSDLVMMQLEQMMGMNW